jgi:hypothetical protein
VAPEFVDVSQHPRLHSGAIIKEERMMSLSIPKLGLFTQYAIGRKRFSWGRRLAPEWDSRFLASRGLETE